MLSSELLLSLVESLSSGAVKIIDLSQPLSAKTPIIQIPPEMGQSKPFSMSQISRYCENGPFWYWNNISMGEHTGTHFDAPIHWASGKDFEMHATDTIDPSRFIAPACVIDLTAEAAVDEGYLLTIDKVKAWEKLNGQIPAGAWALLRTDWSKRTGADFLNIKENGAVTPGLEPDCVKWLAEERDICGVGVETVGTDAGQGFMQDPPFPCHTFMHGTNKFGLASLTNLDQMPSTGSVLIAAPLKIEDGSGSPLRVLALVADGTASI